jgi:hypothetical protein
LGRDVADELVEVFSWGETPGDHVRVHGVVSFVRSPLVGTMVGRNSFMPGHGRSMPERFVSILLAGADGAASSL